MGPKQNRVEDKNQPILNIVWGQTLSPCCRLAFANPAQSPGHKSDIDQQCEE